MKIGDQFTHTHIGAIWQLVRDTEGNKIRLLALPEMEIYGPGVIPKSYDSIDEAEFCELMGIKDSGGYVNLDGSPLFPEETYRYGDIFEIIAYPTNDDSVGQKLMLCQVDTGKYCLITIDGFSCGNRWTHPVEPKDNMAITKEELKQMCGSAQSVVLKKVNE